MEISVTCAFSRVACGKGKRGEGRRKSRIVISTMDVYHGRWTNWCHLGVSLMFLVSLAQLVIFTSGEIFSDRATFRASQERTVEAGWKKRRAEKWWKWEKGWKRERESNGTYVRRREEEKDKVDALVGVEGGKRGSRRGWKYEVSILLLRISTWLRDGGCAQGEKVGKGLK